PFVIVRGRLIGVCTTGCIRAGIPFLLRTGRRAARVGEGEGQRRHPAGGALRQRDRILGWSSVRFGPAEEDRAGVALAAAHGNALLAPVAQAPLGDGGARQGGGVQVQVLVETGEGALAG